LVGNIGQDVELKYMQSGEAVCNLSVATSESWKDKSTNERVERTEWHKVVLFSKLAEIAEKYLKKGSKVYIEGSLQTRKWQGQDGNDRYTTEIKARDMQMLDSKGADLYVVPAQQKAAAPQAAAPQADNFDDDIPF